LCTFKGRHNIRDVNKARDPEKLETSVADGKSAAGWTASTAETLATAKTPGTSTAKPTAEVTLATAESTATAEAIGTFSLHCMGSFLL
jgi:cytoskeletal protein RodZ